MKPLAIFLGIVLLVFGGFAIGYHLFRDSNPDRVLVVVDSSFPMGSEWGEVATTLDRIDDERYAEFALVTEKGAVHSWSAALDLGATEPFAPRDFSDLEAPDAYPEIAEADEIIIVTNASEPETAVFEGWKVRAPGS